MMPRKMQTKLPPAARWTALLAGGGLAIASLVATAMAVVGAGQLVWPMLLFQPVAAGAGVAAVLAALGPQRSAPPLALAVAAGSAAIAAFLGYTGGRNTLDPGTLGILLGVQGATSGVIGLLAVALVLGRDRRAWLRVGLGLALLAIGAAFAGVGVLERAKPVRDALASTGPILTPAIGLVAFGVFMAVVAAGVHLVIRPFEARLDAARDAADADSA
ncbi:MAG: hypothetical protein AAFX79_05675 [Planctomycetota bacterium]